MIVEQMLKNAPNPLLHIADVSGSALFNADCMEGRRATVLLGVRARRVSQRQTG